MRFSFSLIFLSVSLLFLISCKTVVNREQEMAAVQAFKETEPRLLIYTSSHPELWLAALRLGVFTYEEHQRFSYYIDAVDTRDLYHGYRQSVDNIMQEEGKTREEAEKIVLEDYKEDLPELNRAILANHAVNEETYTAEVKDFYKPFTRTKNSLAKLGVGVFNVVTNSVQGHPNYVFYAELKTMLDNVAAAECEDLDDALNAVITGKRPVRPTSERICDLIAKRLIDTKKKTPPEEWHQAIKDQTLANLKGLGIDPFSNDFNFERFLEQVIPAEELQGMLCDQSAQLKDIASALLDEARYTEEEVVTDKNGKPKKDKDGNVKTKTVVKYRQMPPPSGSVDGLITLRIMEANLEIIRQCAVYAEAQEKSKREADKNAEEIQ